MGTFAQQSPAHFHSTQSTWPGRCCSMCSPRASSPGCPGRRCCLQTLWASQWGRHSLLWPHGEGRSHEVSLRSHWPLVGGGGWAEQRMSVTKGRTQNQEENWATNHPLAEHKSNPRAETKIKTHSSVPSQNPGGILIFPYENKEIYIYICIYTAK